MATTAPSESTEAAQSMSAPSCRAVASGASLPESWSGVAIPIAPSAVKT